MKFSLRKIHLVSKVEYKNMIFDARNIVFIAMYIVLYDKILKQFIEMGEKMNEPINIIEPFIALSGSGLVVIIVPLVFLVLVSDFPRVNSNINFYIIRSGKINWFFGQLFAVFKLIITYLVLSFVSCIAIVLPNSYIGNTWSDVVTKYYLRFPAETNSQANNLINATLYNQTTPADAVINIFLLYMLFLMIISAVCMVAFVFSIRNIGLYFLGILISLGGIFSMANTGDIMWLFPSTHILLWKHYDDIFKKQIYPISQSYIMFIIALVILIITSLIMIKHKRFELTEEM